MKQHNAIVCSGCNFELITFRSNNMVLNNGGSEEVALTAVDPENRTFSATCPECGKKTEPFVLEEVG